MGITRINTNISALTAQGNINKIGGEVNKSIQRLSSGLRINSAGDDAAGLVVANRLRTQVDGLNQAVSNAQDGINLISVAEGALNESGTRLNRIRELAIQAANTGVNDYKARLAIQDEISQSIDEITRIANTTAFAGNVLLNGNFAISSKLKDGQDDVGVNIDASSVASSLGNGTSFLNIQLNQVGNSQIVAGDGAGNNQILSTGIINQTDIAVSTGIFTQDRAFQGANVTAALPVGDLTSGSVFFNGISVATATSQAVFTFTGVLSDGTTQFNGSFSLASSVGTANSVGGLVSTVRAAIDTAEQALFGVTTANSVPTSFRTQVTIGANGTTNEGRIILYTEGNLINQASLDITFLRSGNVVTQANGVTRSGPLGEGSGISGQGQIGNTVLSITGSTFGSGDFTINVQDVQGEQQRLVESTIVFRDANGSILDRTASLNGASTSSSIRLNGTFESGVYTGGVSLTDGDVITLRGTNADGTTFSSNFTYDRSPGASTVDVDNATQLNDFTFASVSGLVAEFNFRSRDYQGTLSGVSDGDQTRFEDAIFTFTPAGTIQLYDDYGRSNSQTSFTLTFQQGANAPDNYTLQDEAELKQEGFAESATLSINGGEKVRAEAGDVVTLKGAEASLAGVPQPEVTFRLGSGLTSGTDILVNQTAEYVGRLNGGPEVTFNAGDQDVVFFTQSSAKELAKFITIDFDSIVDVTKSASGTDAGTTVLFSTVNSALNFQVGANSGQNLQFTLGNTKAVSLGFGAGSGRTVQDLDVSTLTGASDALDVVDEALEQVNRTRSILGAATNRLQATISNLSVASENLTASESRIRDADIASETSNFTKNQVLLQAGVSVLAQANFQGQSFLQLLG